jgi:hypothetical protein
MNKYRIVIFIMMLSYLYLSINGGSIKMKIIGFLSETNIFMKMMLNAICLLVCTVNTCISTI